MDIEKLRKKFPDGIIRNQHPYYMADAIRDIPGCLAACIHSEITSQITEAAAAFKLSKIFAVGCGTSFNACQAASYTLQNLLQIPAFAYDAYDFEVDTPPGIDSNTLVIGISESGQSITTCLSIELANVKGAFTVGISANPTSRLAKSARLALIDPFLHEIPLGKTRTYLSSTVLAILAGLYTQPNEAIRFTVMNELKQSIELLQNQMESISQEAQKVSDSLPVRQTRYIVTGFGAQKSNADEIRLKIMEVLGESATSFGLEEFTHGPSACFKDDLTVLLLQTDPRTTEKAVRIANGVTFSQANLVVITDAIAAKWPQKAKVLPIHPMNNGQLFNHFQAVIAAQYLLYHLAIRKSLNPDVNLEDISPELGDIYAFFFPPGTH